MTGAYGKIVKYTDDGREHPFVVYLALNQLNGDFYIGATEKGTKGRSNVHRWQSHHYEKSHLHFYRAIRKYGERNFKFITIKECSDYWDALESERQYIALLNPRYNMTTGGGGVKGHKMSDESRSKMSMAKRGKTGRKMTAEMRAHLSSVKTGVGINFTESGLEKIRLNALKANSARRRSVVCITDGKIYPSLTEASKEYGLTTGQITYHCSGNHKSRRGLQFRYVDGDE